MVFLSFIVNLYSQTLEEYIQYEYKKTYPSLIINTVSIEPLSQGEPIPPFHMSTDMLKGNKGVISTHNPKGGKLFFRYTLDASLTVFTTTNAIKRGESFSENYIITQIPFIRQPLTPPTHEQLIKGVASRFLPPHKMLTSNDVQEPPTLKKGQTVEAFVISEGIELTFLAFTLEEGYKGENIRIKNKEGKVYTAKIVTESRVEIK